MVCTVRSASNSATRTSTAIGLRPSRLGAEGTPAQRTPPANGPWVNKGLHGHQPGLSEVLSTMPSRTVPNVPAPAPGRPISPSPENQPPCL